MPSLLIILSDLRGYENLTVPKARLRKYGIDLRKNVSSLGISNNRMDLIDKFFAESKFQTGK